MSADNLTRIQRDDLRTIAAMIVPASDEYKVPGADDPAIRADMLATLGRDTKLVAAALDHLARLASQPLAELDAARRDAVAQEFREAGGVAAATTRPCRAAMLLPRRPRAALAGDRAARAVPQRACAAGWRLVAARSGQGEGRLAEAGPLAIRAVQPCAPGGHLARQ